MGTASDTTVIINSRWIKAAAAEEGGAMVGDEGGTVGRARMVTLEEGKVVMES